MKTTRLQKLWPFAIGGGVTLLVFTLILLAAIAGWLAAPSLLTGILLFLMAALWLLVLYFFRDPEREPVNEPGQVIGPGDGTVVDIVHEGETDYLKADCVRISMFLSLTNVHVQRVPLGGVIEQIRHQPGKFLQAFRPEASEENEHLGMVIESGRYGRLLVKQIAGILARRCVNHMQVGDHVTTGQRYGLIRFGSRIDLYLPPTAKILVEINDKITGGITPMAILEEVER